MLLSPASHKSLTRGPPTAASKHVSTRPRLTVVRAVGGGEGQQQNSEWVQMQPRFLPGGAMWCLNAVQDQFYNLHGQDFVIKRGEENEQASRPSRKKSGRMLVNQRRQDKAPEMVHKHVWNAPPMVLMLEGAVVDVADLECSPFDVDVEDASATAPPPANDTFTGIVSVSPPASIGTLDEEEDESEGICVEPSSSPRRTKVVGFTCQKCGARNHKNINPKSFLQGTLVCQCQCGRKHIVTDHLKLFSENVLNGSLKGFKGPEIRVAPEHIPAALRHVDMSVLDE